MDHQALVLPVIVLCNLELYQGQPVLVWMAIIAFFHQIKTLFVNPAIIAALLVQLQEALLALLAIVRLSITELLLNPPINVSVTQVGTMMQQIYFALNAT